MTERTLTPGYWADANGSLIPVTDGLQEACRRVCEQRSQSITTGYNRFGHRASSLCRDLDPRGHYRYGSIGHRHDSAGLKA